VAPLAFVHGTYATPSIWQPVCGACCSHCLACACCHSVPHTCLLVARKRALGLSRYVSLPAY